MSFNSEKSELDYAASLNSRSNQKARIELAAQVEDFLKSGGTITKIPPVCNVEMTRHKLPYGHDLEKPIPPTIRYFKGANVWKTIDKDGKWTGNYSSMSQAILAQTTYSKRFSPNVKNRERSEKPHKHKKIALTKKSKHTAESLANHIKKFYVTE